MANPPAAVAIAQRLSEALVRGLWTPRRNAVQGELERARSDISGAAPKLEAAQ